jgi:hypothetical protein
MNDFERQSPDQQKEEGGLSVKKILLGIFGVAVLSASVFLIYVLFIDEKQEMKKEMLGWIDKVEALIRNQPTTTTPVAPAQTPAAAGTGTPTTGPVATTGQAGATPVTPAAGAPPATPVTSAAGAGAQVQQAAAAKPILDKLKALAGSIEQNKGITAGIIAAALVVLAGIAVCGVLLYQHLTGHILLHI